MDKNEIIEQLLRNQANSTYFLLDNINNEIKIGLSINPKKRLRKIKSENPNREITLLAYIPFNIETFLHQKLIQYRIKNEWFKDCKEIREIIKICKEIMNNSEFNKDFRILKLTEKLKRTENYYRDNLFHLLHSENEIAFLSKHLNLFTKFRLRLDKKKRAYQYISIKKEREKVKGIFEKAYKDDIFPKRKTIKIPEKLIEKTSLPIKKGKYFSKNDLSTLDLQMMTYEDYTKNNLGDYLTFEEWLYNEERGYNIDEEYEFNEE